LYFQANFIVTVQDKHFVTSVTAANRFTFTRHNSDVGYQRKPSAGFKTMWISTALAIKPRGQPAPHGPQNCDTLVYSCCVLPLHCHNSQ